MGKTPSPRQTTLGSAPAQRWPRALLIAEKIFSMLIYILLRMFHCWRMRLHVDFPLHSESHLVRYINPRFMEAHSDPYGPQRTMDLG